MILCNFHDNDNDNRASERSERAAAAASLASRALSDGNNKTNKLPGEQSGPGATLQARFTRRIQETGNRVRLAPPLNALRAPDDRVNARLPTPAPKTAATATYKRDAIYPPTCTLHFFFHSANNDARIMHRPSRQREFNGSRGNPPTRQ